MRITDVTIGGFKAFPTHVRVPLGALPGTVTAVAGDNGAGKTTFATLAVMGALYREGPGDGSTKQSPNAIAQARDAHVEVDVAVGRRDLRIRQTFDAQKGGGKALVLDLATNQPVATCRNGGIKEYNAWAANTLPDPDVVRAGMFLSQGTDGLLSIGDAARASVVLRALGSDRLERLAEATRKRATATENELKTTVKMLAAERERCGDVRECRANLDAARAALAAAQEASARAEATYHQAKEAEQAQLRYEQAQRRLDAIRSQYDDAQQASARGEGLAERLRSAAALDAQLSELGAALAGIERDKRQAQEDMRREADAASVAMARVYEIGRRTSGRRSELDQQIYTQRSRIDDFGRRLANNRSLLADAEEIRAAAARVAEADASAASLRDKYAQHTAGANLADERAESEARREQEAHARVEAAIGRAQELRRRLENEASVRALAATLPTARADVQQAEMAVRALQDRVDALKIQAASMVTSRHAAMRSVVQAIADGTGRRRDAIAAIAADDDAAAEQAILPDAIAADQQALREAEEVARAAQSRLQAAERADGMLASIDRDAADKRRAEAEGEKASQEREAARQAKEQQRSLAAILRTDIGKLDAALAALMETRAQDEAKARHANKLDVAEERIADLTAAIATARADIASAESALARLKEETARDTEADRAEMEKHERARFAAGQRIMNAAADAVTLSNRARALREERDAMGDVAGQAAEVERARATVEALGPTLAEAMVEESAASAALVTSDTPCEALAWEALQHAQHVERVAVAKVASEEAAFTVADEAAERIGDLEQKRRDQEVLLADLRELAEDLGRKGIQADLVDGAAPTLTALTNELLRAAGVTRWTVRFCSSKTRKSDNAEVTAFPLMVRDEETGEEREAHAFSGGEKVLIDAGACNAVAALACERAGIEGPVLVRDETGAALSPKNERAWMAMLRHMVKMTGASRVLVITHSPTLKAQCDSVLTVGGGRVAVADRA